MRNVTNTKHKQYIQRIIHSSNYVLVKQRHSCQCRRNLSIISMLLLYIVVDFHPINRVRVMIVALRSLVSQHKHVAWTFCVLAPGVRLRMRSGEANVFHPKTLIHVIGKMKRCLFHSLWFLFFCSFQENWICVVCTRSNEDATRCCVVCEQVQWKM